MTTPEDVLGFWFQESLADEAALDDHLARWFRRDVTFDRLIADRFGPDIERAGRNALGGWANEPRGRLALIILLDQFPRNAFRGLAQAYALDARAADLSVAGIALGADADLAPVERLFFYLPLLHAEHLDLQRQSVACFERLLAAAPRRHAQHFVLWVKLARRHRRVIRCFGRFPHRNKTLGRPATIPETMFLAARAAGALITFPPRRPGRRGGAEVFA